MMPARLLRSSLLALLALLVVLVVPALALADAVPSPQPTLALPGVQVWALLAGALSPLLGYVLNHYAPWATEPIKALAQVLLAAVLGAVTQLLDAGTFALNIPTLEVVGTAVIAALLAHQTLWLPSGISTRLGGGSNAQPTPTR